MKVAIVDINGKETSDYDAFLALLGCLTRAYLNLVLLTGNKWCQSDVVVNLSILCLS